MELNIRLTLLVIETTGLEWIGINDMAQSVKQARPSLLEGGLKRANLANSLEAKYDLETRV